MSNEKDTDWGDIRPVSENKSAEKKPQNKNSISGDIITNEVQHPVVLFVGPKEVGKTVALLRLANYITQHENCSVEVNPSFRLDSSTYDDVVKAFYNELSDKYYTPNRTGNINFLLLDIVDKSGELLTHILEAPGEHYFDPVYPDNKKFELYLSQIMFHSSQKKVFVFFFENYMLGSDRMRMAYAKRLVHLIKYINHERDKIIFLYNKADKDHSLRSGGKLNSTTIKDKIFRNPGYQPLINELKNSQKLARIIFLPFSSGTFHQSSGKRQMWSQSDNKYPKMLWKAIKESVKRSKWRWW